jgi:hypothetical protein
VNQLRTVDSGDPGRPTNRRWWETGRVLIVSIASAAALLVIVGVAAERFHQGGTSDVPAELERLVAAVIRPSDCVPPATAAGRLRASLDASSFADWTVLWGGGVGVSGCISVGFNTIDRRLVLIPTARPEVKEAMEEVRQDLLARCLGEEGAIEAVASALSRIGEHDPAIRTDGPVVFQVSQKDQVISHVAAGCFVYSGMSWTAEGVPVYWVGGSASQRQRPVLSDRPRASGAAASRSRGRREHEPRSRHAPLPFNPERSPSRVWQLGKPGATVRLQGPAPVHWPAG